MEQGEPMTTDAAPQLAEQDPPTTEWVLGRPVVAAVAVHAATGVAGVVRMEPGLVGLAASMARAARRKVAGLNPAPADGVRVDIDGGRVRLELDLVVSGQDQATAVAQAVQRAVAAEVASATGLVVDTVAVSILDIQIDGHRR
jgi:uncharacterized alkaline shock family protein YloU